MQHVTEVVDRHGVVSLPYHRHGVLWPPRAGLQERTRMVQQRCKAQQEHPASNGQPSGSRRPSSLGQTKLAAPASPTAANRPHPKPRECAHRSREQCVLHT